MRISRVIALAFVVLSVGAVTASATPPGANGLIAFRQYLDVGKTTGALFTMRPDGSGVKQLTSPKAGVIDQEPDWSANGRRIAFERKRPCGAKDGLDNTCDLVYVADRDGTGVRSLVPCGFDADARFPGNCVGAHTPAWSPDGSRIAFRYSLVDRRYVDSLRTNVGIWVVNADGSGLRQVTQREPGNSWDYSPQWSPDGTKIAFFRRDISTDWESIVTVNVDSGREVRVSPRTLNAANPDWSPDGRWILFNGEVRGASNVYKARPNGSRLTNLTRQPAAGYHYLSASFSPNGRQIVSARTRGEGAADVVVMNADGSNVRQITNTPLWESAVDWGPRLGSSASGREEVRGEDRLSRAASQLALRQVEVRCPSAEEWARDPATAFGAWSYADVRLGYAALQERLCAGALAVGDRDVPAWQRAVGVLALAHESFHLRRWQHRYDEAKVTCEAIRQLKVAVLLLGGSSEVANELLPYALAFHVRTVELFPVYREPRCRLPVWALPES